MSLGGVGFYSLTTTVAPGAGTKIGAHEEVISGNKVYYQGVLIGFLSAGGIFCPASVDTPLPVIPQVDENTGVNTPLFNESQVTTTETTKATYTVTAGTVYQTMSAALACQFDGAMRVKVNGTTVKTLRTGPGQPTVSIPVCLPVLVAGDVITLTHEVRAGAPLSALVAVSLDGKIKNA